MYKMVVKDNCSVCENNKKKLADANLLDQVEVVHISTTAGLSLAKEYKLKMAGSDILDISAGTKMTVEEFIQSQSGR